MITRKYRSSLVEVKRQQTPEMWEMSQQNRSDEMRKRSKEMRETAGTMRKNIAKRKKAREACEDLIQRIPPTLLS
jgi:transketolase